jgi:hypothetical protein
MRLIGMRSLCVCALLAVCASTASAQLVFGSTSTNTLNGAAFYLDVNSGQVTTLWNSAANKKVNGLAADPVSGRLYCNDAARLNYWNYGTTLGTVPTFIAGMYRVYADPNHPAATGVDGLAFANGKLYGATSYGSTTYKRGIYEIGTVPVGGGCLMTPVWLDPTGVGTLSGTIALSGFEFNPADNLFYSTQTADTTGTGGTYTRGIYSIDAFGTGALTKIADFPTGRTGIDGLAIGGGKFWLTEQEPTASRIDIYPYDPVTGTYGATIYVPLTDATQRATGACWAPGAIPEPGTLSALAVCLVGLSLRRRS